MSRHLGNAIWLLLLLAGTACGGSSAQSPGAAPQPVAGTTPYIAPGPALVQNQHAVPLTTQASAASGPGATQPQVKTITGTLASGDSRISERSSTNDNSFYDSYQEPLQAGDTIRITLESNDFDAYLHLVGPDGSRVADADDIAEGQNTNAFLTYTAVAPGNYEILANSYAENETGAYTLTVEIIRSAR